MHTVMLNGVPIGIHMLDVFFEDVAEMGLNESAAVDEIMIGVHKHNFVNPQIEHELRNEILSEYRKYLKRISKTR